MIKCPNLIAATLSCAATFSQQKNTVSSSRSLSVEIGKTGLIFNLYYDQKISKSGYRFGAGSNFGKYFTSWSFGGGGYYLFGKEKIFFETGAELNYLNFYQVSDDQRGIRLVYPGHTIKSLLVNINLGLRHYSKKLLYRIGASPCFIKDGFIPGGYISMGLVL